MPSSTSLPKIVCCFLPVILALPLSCRATDAEDDLRKDEIAATFAEVQTRAHTSWVELLTPRYYGRRYIHVISAPDARVPRIEYRIDKPGNEEYPVVSTIWTLDLNCDDGETSLVGIRGYAEDGTETFSKTHPPKPAERIWRFYSHPLARYCSGEFALDALPESHWIKQELLPQVMARYLNEKRDTIPDRDIPIANQ